MEITKLSIEACPSLYNRNAGTGEGPQLLKAHKQLPISERHPVEPQEGTFGDKLIASETL
jgi:hypothetical protein